MRDRNNLRRPGRRPLAVGVGARLLVGASLGVLAAVLVSCGGSGAGLIPSQNAGPLLRDFQAVEAAAKAGNGSCASTKAAIRTTESDYQHLPTSVDAGLHGRLQEGISKLRELALEMCVQSLPQITTGEATSTAKTAAPPTATTGIQTTTGEATSPAGTGTTSGTTTSGTEGGTAPGVGSSEGQEEGVAGGGQDPGNGSGEGAKNGGGARGDSGSGGTGIGGGTGGGGEH